MANNPTPSEFYEAVGLAIVQWSRIEHALSDLFTRLTVCGLTGRGLGLGKEKESPTGEGMFIVGNIFYSTTNFRGRLDLLDHMFNRLVADESLRSEWNVIKNKAGQLYKRRNILAHGEAWSGGHSNPEFMRYSVFSTQDQSMGYQQIREATPSFDNFAQRITQLAIDTNGHLAARERYPEDLSDQAGID